jgi:sulfur-oxidizing protein SoxY
MRAAWREFKLNATTRRAALQVIGFFGLTRMIGGAHAASAPGWPEQAFKQKTEDDAVRSFYGKPLSVSDEVMLEAPEIAENGAVVPVSVRTSLPNVTSISILAPQNPLTIAAAYKMSDATVPSIACRLKLAKTGEVIAVVESDGKLYSASKQVKVTIGGCGG